METKLFKERQVRTFSEVKRFLRDLDFKSQQDTYFNFKFTDQAERNNLRRKLLMYFSNARVATDQNISSLHDAILSLGLSANDNVRRKFLYEGSSGMSAKHLLNWYERQKEAKEKSEEGFETLYTSADYKLSQVVGTPKQRRRAFKAIAGDLPGNCLGRTSTGYYLKKPDTDILVLKDAANKNLVAIEYNRKTRSIVQVEGNKAKGEGRVRPEAPFLPAFLSFVCSLIRDGKLTALQGVSSLENGGPLVGKVITRAGDIRPVAEVPKSEVIFPSPLFSEPSEVVYPRESHISPEEFFKPRTAEVADAVEKTYRVAGLHILPGVAEKVVKKESLNAAIKSIELNKSARDLQIAAGLGIRCAVDGSMTEEQERSNEGKLFTLKEIQTLMEMQMSFVDGRIAERYLQTDGFGNIFYVKGTDGRVRPFYCLWFSRTLEWKAGLFRFGVGWPFGCRVFGRNMI